MLIIRGVNVFPSNIEAVLAREERLAPHYLLELRRPGSLDELDVVVETRTALGGKLTGTELAELERRTEHTIKALVGITTKVRVVEPGTLERSQGKAKRVLDLRPKE
jgi:phenylacetate-CoA ligase